MIVCQCTGTTDRDIARLRAEGTRTAAAVAHATGAGMNCDSCRHAIGQLLGDSSSAGPAATPANIG